MTEDTIKIERLACEVAVLRRALGTLTCWLVRELGEAGVRQLLAMLEPTTPVRGTISPEDEAHNAELLHAAESDPPSAPRADVRADFDTYREAHGEAGEQSLGYAAFLDVWSQARAGGWTPEETQSALREAEAEAGLLHTPEEAGPGNAS